jgi:hypothetical protein
MKNKKIYVSTRDFNKDYKNIKEILQDENIEEEIKEDGYNNFLNTYPLFDSKKLDKFCKWRVKKEKKYKDISDKESEKDKEKLKKDITPTIRGTIISYLAMDYSIESISEAVKEVAEELKTDGPILEFKEYRDKR